jgi:hypothetical protein
MIIASIIIATAIALYATFKAIQACDRAQSEIIEEQAYYDRLMGTKL